MIEATVVGPDGQRRTFRIPAVCVSMLELIEQASLEIERAEKEQRPIRITFNVKGSAVRLSVELWYD